jgi:hypothetical protein
MATVETKFRKRQISFKLKTADDTVQDVFLGFDTVSDPVTVSITGEDLLIQAGQALSKIERVKTAMETDMNTRIGTNGNTDGIIYTSLDSELDTRIVPIKSNVHTKLNTTIEKAMETIDSYVNLEKTAFNNMATNRSNLKATTNIIASMESYATVISEAIEFENYGIYNGTIKGVTFGVDLFAPNLNPVTSTNGGTSTTFTTQEASYDRYLRVYFVSESGNSNKNRLIDSNNVVIRDGDLSREELVSRGAKFFVGDNVKPLLSSTTIPNADFNVVSSAASFVTSSSSTLYDLSSVTNPELFFSIRHKLYFYKPAGVSSYYVVRNSDGTLLQGYKTSSINKTTEFYLYVELLSKKYTTDDVVTIASGKLSDLTPVLTGYKTYIVSSADIVVKNKLTNLYYVLRTKADVSNTTAITSQYYLTKLRTLYGMHLKDGYYSAETLTKSEMQIKRVFFYSEDYESSAISIAEPGFSNAYAWAPLDAATITTATLATVQSLISSNPSVTQDYVRTMAALYNNNADMYAVLITENRSDTAVYKPLRHKNDGYRIITGADTGARSASAQDIQNYLTTHGTYLTGPVDDLSQPTGNAELGPTTVTPVGFAEVAPAETAVLMATPSISASLISPRIRLTWTEVSNATEYLIKFSTTSTFSAGTVTDLVLPSGTFTYLFTVANSDLLEGTTYYFKIAGGNTTFPANAATFSAVVNATTTSTPVSFSALFTSQLDGSANPKTLQTPTVAQLDEAMVYNTFKAADGLTERVVRIGNFYFFQVSGANMSTASSTGKYAAVYKNTSGTVAPLEGSYGSIQEVYDAGGRVATSSLLASNDAFSFTVNQLRALLRTAYNASTNAVGFRVLPVSTGIENITIANESYFTVDYFAPWEVYRMFVNRYNASTSSYDAPVLIMYSNNGAWNNLINTTTNRRTPNNVMIAHLGGYGDNSDQMYSIEDSYNNLIATPDSAGTVWNYRTFLHRENISSPFRILRTSTPLTREKILENYTNNLGDGIGNLFVIINNTDVPAFRPMIASETLHPSSYVGAPYNLTISGTAGTQKLVPPIIEEITNITTDTNVFNVISTPWGPAINRNGSAGHYAFFSGNFFARGSRTNDNVMIARLGDGLYHVEESDGHLTSGGWSHVRLFYRENISSPFRFLQTANLLSREQILTNWAMDLGDGAGKIFVSYEYTSGIQNLQNPIVSSESLHPDSYIGTPYNLTVSGTAGTVKLVVPY